MDILLLGIARPRAKTGTVDSIRQNRLPLRTVWFRERFTGTLLKHSPATPYTVFSRSTQDISYRITIFVTRRLASTERVAPASPIAGPNFPAK
jgi:hypothetical protein